MDVSFLFCFVGEVVFFLKHDSSLKRFPGMPDLAPGSVSCLWGEYFHFFFLGISYIEGKNLGISINILFFETSLINPDYGLYIIILHMYITYIHFKYVFVYTY